MHLEVEIQVIWTDTRKFKLRQSSICGAIKCSFKNWKILSASGDIWTKLKFWKLVFSPANFFDEIPENEWDFTIYVGKHIMASYCRVDDPLMIFY